MKKKVKIFIEIPTWLGDAVMTTPAIENIVNHYANSQLELTIFGSFVSTRLFQYHPNVVNIIIDETRKGGYRYYNLYKKAKESGKFDFCISFRKNFTTKFLIYCIDAPKKYIYKRYDKELATHQVIRYNDFINRSFSLQTTPNSLKIYQKKNATSDPKEQKITLGINPGATYGSAKRWYPEEFARVAIALASKYDITLFGGPTEIQIAADIEKSLQKEGITNYQNLAGKTSVDELIEKISTLTLFITNDSGPMHVAAAFRVPTVAIFGPTRHIETHQWNNPKEMILRKEMACAPCMKRICPLKDEKQNHACMKQITAADVLERVALENL